MIPEVVENYMLIEVIGSIKNGKVYKALNIKNNSCVAIKVFEIEQFREVPELEELTMNEILTLTIINNPCVVKFIEILKSFRHYYFVYEYCNDSTLEAIIQEQGVQTEKVAFYYFRQLVQAFQSLVSENIIHRNLKPSNIMLHSGQIKLGGFRFCKGMNAPQDLSLTMVGSLNYMAPEILKGQEHSVKADIWSLGCVLYELLYGIPPFKEKTMAKLLLELEEREIQFLDNVNVVSQTTKNLLLRMLTKDQNKRINWKVLFERELTQTERKKNNIEQQPNQIQQGLTFNSQIYQASKVLKYLLMERNKIFYLQKVLEEVLEFTKNERDEQRVSQSVFCGYLIAKYISYLNEMIRMNLVEKFNISAFPYLAKKLELQNDITKTLEYKSFCTLIQKECKIARKMFQDFQETADIFFKSQTNGQHIYQGTKFTHFENELEREISSFEISITFMKKFVLKYCEDLKSQYLQQFLDNNPQSGNKQLLHIEKTLESLILDEFFENCMDYRQIDLEQQNYFANLNKYPKADLLQIITNKMDYIRHKLYKQ
ncbi:unnamed protein product [Paramecium primaurelia]|uniref:Protein kinase domain-containing protein n=1 Tax=Paramecium primaurelia TaxID=5886 RepID=A0A8S1JMJ1_PARPR|nr:unnamed protein product [Paramecium primaurelia]